MDELRKSNKDLLQKLKIGQAKAWDILNSSSVVENSRPRNSIVEENIVFKPPYTFSTPTKTYIDFLDKVGNERYSRLATKTPNSPKNITDPLSEIMNLSSSSSYGRPHKTPSKTLSKDTENSLSSPVHSPHCTENHRDRLHRKLNASYSKLAADLRQIAPAYGADLAYDLSVNSGLQNKPDSYYDDLKKFRMANSDLCSVKLPDQLSMTRDSTHIEEKENLEKSEETDHQCIQTYSVGDGYRAFDAHGGGQCPLCIGANDTKHKGLIRVNIPHKDLVNYKVHPKDVDDSISLSSHCSMGWDVTSTQYKSRKQY